MSTMLAKLVSIATAHSELETGLEPEALLAALEPDPVFELYPIARQFSGMAKTRRYYQHYFTEVLPRITCFKIRSEAVSEMGLAREYDIKLVLPGADAPSLHRIFAILTFGPEKLSGGRFYSDEKLLRLMVGPLWSSLEPIPAD
jgi:hypothetical protein